MVKRIFIIFLILLFSLTAFAAEKEAANTTQTRDAKTEETDAAKAKAPELTRLDEVVVTATRTEKNLEVAPGKVDVVTQADIEKRHINTVDDALNTLSGVYDRRHSLTDTQASIALHGIPSQKRTMILKDGMILNNAYDGSVSFAGLPTENIDRIEVVQGPFSSLYGGNAMGGVVNILTKMPEQREFKATAGYGSSWDRGESLDDFQKYYVSYGDKLFDKFSVLVHYGYKSTNGFPKYLNVSSRRPDDGIIGWSYTANNKGNVRYLIGDKGDNTWVDENVGFKAQYEFSKATKLNVSYEKVRYEYGYDDPHTYLRDAAGNPVYSYTGVSEKTYVAYTGSGAKDINQYNASLETEIGIVKSKLSFGLNDEVKNWYTQAGSLIAGGAGGTVSSTPNQNYNADIQFTIPVFTRHLLTFGGSMKCNKADTEKSSLANWKDETSTIALTNNYGGKSKTFAVFLQDEILILNNLTVYVGFRQDWWESYDGYANQFGTGAFNKTYNTRGDSSFNPKFSLVYAPFESTTLRASAGQSFRGPTVYELFATYVSGSSTYNGNPDLKPETVRSWDVGISQKLWRGAKVSATYFENYMQDLIYNTSIATGQYQYQNAGRAESKGVMFEIEQRYKQYLRVFANYTYTDARIKENNANQASVDKRITFMPDTTINAGAECDIGPFSASVTGRYIGKRYSTDTNTDIINNVFGSYDPFFTADAKVAYQICRFAKISFSVDNIANETYYSSYLAPGRSWFAGLEVQYR